MQHDRDKPLGRISEALASEPAELDVHMAGGELPALAGYDRLVVLPGLANPDDDDPSLDRARGAIRDALDSGLPVLGLCLGGQLLVQVLGGSTYRCRTEVGFHEVAATEALGDDPLLGDAPARFRTFHAHAYAFTPPPVATVLLQNDVCVQACRMGESWAFQCHPEPTVAWLDALAAGIQGRTGWIRARRPSFATPVSTRRRSGPRPAPQTRLRAGSHTALRMASSNAAARRCADAARRSGTAREECWTWRGFVTQHLRAGIVQ